MGDAGSPRFPRQATTDRELVEALFLGEEHERDAAWRTLIDRFAPSLVAALMRGNQTVRFSEARARECVDEFFQHVFAYTKLKALLRSELSEVRLRPYLITSVRRFASREYPRLVGSGSGDTQDRALAFCGPPAKGGSPQQNAEARELHAAVRAWVRSRSEDDRCVLLFELGREVTGLGRRDMRSIARKLALTPGALQQHLDKGTQGQEAAALLGISRDVYYARASRLRKALEHHLASLNLLLETKRGRRGARARRLSAPSRP